MNDHCENCGRQVMDTDTVCWHCGWPVAAGENGRSSVSAAMTAGLETPFSLTAIAVYAGLTAIIFVAVMWTMRSLGRQPLNIQDPGQSPAPGWRSFVSQDETFAVQLPPGWDLIQASHAEFDQLIAATRIGNLLAPFAESGHKLDSQAVAGDANSMNTVGASFLLIAHEVGNDRLTAEQAIAALRQREAGFELLQAALATDSAGETTSTLLFDMNDAGQTYRCRASLTQRPGTSYLVATCASRLQFSSQAGSLQAILESFRTLPG